MNTQGKHNTMTTKQVIEAWEHGVEPYLSPYFSKQDQQMIYSDQPFPSILVSAEIARRNALQNITTQY